MKKILLIPFPAGQNVVFVREPQDTKAVSGNDAFFPCTYTGTRGAPHWSVNQTRAYPVSALPSGHSHNDTGLIVHSVDISMNATKYQCCFEFHVGQGVIKPVCSSAGMLIIITAGQKFFVCFDITRQFKDSRLVFFIVDKFLQARY